MILFALLEYTGSVGLTSKGSDTSKDVPVTLAVGWGGVGMIGGGCIR